MEGAMSRVRRRSPKRLGEILIEEGLLTLDQLEEVLAQQQKSTNATPLGEMLIDQGYISQRDLAKALVLQYAIPYMPATSYNVDFELMSKVPLDVMEQFRFVPLDSFGDTIVIAAAGPLSEELHQVIETNLKMKVSAFASTLEEVSAVLERFKEWKKPDAAKVEAKAEPKKRKVEPEEAAAKEAAPEEVAPEEAVTEEAVPEKAGGGADWSKLMERKEDAEVLKELEKDFKGLELQKAEPEEDTEDDEEV